MIRQNRTVYGMNTQLIYSNLDTSNEGYYFSDYQATDGGMYNIYFRIVFKVGEPQGTYTVPQAEKKMYYTNAWKDQLTKVEYYTNGVLDYYETYSYDTSENVTNISDSRSSNGTTFQWDGRQLSGLGGYCYGMSFKYNDQGIRTEKSISGCSISGKITKYTLDGDKVLVEDDGSNIIYYTYDFDGSLMSMNLNGTEYLYITNLQGDIIKLVDIEGYTVVEYKYDAWGNIIHVFDDTQQLGINLAEKNPYRYRGYRYDEETGWYYLNSRYYNPEIGRFINADGQLNGGILGKNLYAYCENNPVMMVDPSGESLVALLSGITLTMVIEAVIITTLVLATIALVYYVAYNFDDIISGLNSTPGGYSSPPIDSAPGGYSSPPIDSIPGGFSTTLPGFTHEVFNGEGISTGYMLSEGVNSQGTYDVNKGALDQLGKEIGETYRRKGERITKEEAIIIDEWCGEYGVSQHHDTNSYYKSPHWAEGPHTHIRNRHIPFR